MKVLRYLLSGAMMMLAAAGCTESDIDYTPGLPDDESNYGVYFPRQTTNTTLELEPESATVVTYKVRRTRTEGAITVPYTFTESEDGIFIVSPIRFADGERDTEVTIQFPRAELGKEYTITVTIDDPQYVSTYSGNDTALTLSVVRAGWKLLGKGKWRDDILSSIYLGVPTPNAEVSVDIYEREDQPGMYRVQVFNKEYVQALFDGGSPYEATNPRTIIDATDPSKVWIPMHSTGLTLASEQGDIIIASNVDKIFSMDETESQYGTLDENNVITFPIHGVLARLTSVDADNEWRSVNSSGMLRIMLPGARLYDYSLKLERNDAGDGKVGVDITLGEDVASVKYAVMEGRLDDGQVSLASQSLDAGEMSFDGTMSSSDKRLTLKPQATGLYTLICCSYNDAGKMQDYAYIQFGYVLDGEQMPVNLTFGLEQTDEQKGEGYDKTNSVKFYAYGENIYSLRYALRRDDRTDSSLSDKEIVDKFGADMSSADLEKLNAGSYLTMFTGLNGDRGYTLYIEADNGYNSQIFKRSFTTEGRFNPLLDGWTNADFRELNVPLYKRTLMDTRWNLYGFDLLNADGRMIFLGEVDVFDEDEYAGYADNINLRGMMSHIMVDDGKGEDEFHKRTLVPATDTMLGGIYDPYSEYDDPRTGIFAVGCPYIDYQNLGTCYEENVFLVYYAEETLAGYVGSTSEDLYGMVAGQVADGCLAFAPNPFYSAMNMTYRFMGFVGSKSTFGLYMNLVLVDKDVDLGLPEKNRPLMSDILAQTYEREDSAGQILSVPDNYVQIDTSTMPYSERMLKYLRVHNPRVFRYPYADALPPMAHKAVVESSTSSEGLADTSAANGEQPARNFQIARDAHKENRVTARIK